MNYEEVISRVHVYGLEESVRGSKYPMATDLSKVSEDVTPTVVKLATSKQGEGHDNFMNGIIVQMDLTLTNKAWVEAERYHFLDFVSSSQRCTGLRNLIWTAHTSITSIRGWFRS